MSDHDRVRAALAGADAAHELERLLLSTAERLRRGEAPDGLALASLATGIRRLAVLVAQASDDEAALHEAMRALFQP